MIHKSAIVVEIDMNENNKIKIKVRWWKMNGGLIDALIGYNLILYGLGPNKFIALHVFFFFLCMLLVKKVYVVRQ